MLTERTTENSDGRNVMAAGAESGFEFTEIESRLVNELPDTTCGCSHCGGCDGCGL